jgi:hypothetical protein
MFVFTSSRLSSSMAPSRAWTLFASIQVTFRSIQVTFRLIQGTFSTIQGTFSTIHGTFRSIQGTFSTRLSSSMALSRACTLYNSHAVHCVVSATKGKCQVMVCDAHWYWCSPARGCPHQWHCLGPAPCSHPFREHSDRFRKHSDRFRERSACLSLSVSESRSCTLHNMHAVCYGVSGDKGNCRYCKCSVNVQWILSGCSANVQWMFNACSMNVQWRFNECSVNVQWMLSECSVNACRKGRPNERIGPEKRGYDMLLRLNIRGKFREHAMIYRMKSGAHDGTKIHIPPV